MKLIKGTYEGASTFASFDKPVQEMTLEETRGLLQHILFLAMPGGSKHADLVYRELAIAEQTAREQGLTI